MSAVPEESVPSWLQGAKEASDRIVDDPIYIVEMMAQGYADRVQTPEGIASVVGEFVGANIGVKVGLAAKPTVTAAIERILPKKASATAGKAGSAAAASRTKGTGTVWDDITPTQPNIEGTSIPKSFELVNGEKYWVNPNATKHMAEYSTRALSHGQKITEQQLLSSLKSSIVQASKIGYTYNVPVRVGNWELIFSPARQAGQLPVIKHALYIP